MLSLQDSRSGANGAGACSRVLLIYTNPFPQSVATLRQIALDLVALGHTVDALDATKSVSAYLPYLTWRDRLYEVVAAKYRRFVLPVLNGRDRTRDIHAEDLAIPPVPETIPALREATAYGAKVGLAALSSAAGLSGIAVRHDTSEYGEMLKGCWEVAHRAGALAAQIPSDYDAIYVFNGRHAENRPFCDVCERNGEVYRYEAGKLPDTYIVYPGSLFEVEEVTRRMLADPVDVEAGKRFFAARRGREPGTDSHLFTGNQTIGALPQGLGSNGLVAMFTSSDDEFFASRDEAVFGEFPTQNDVACALADICRSFGRGFALRLHPHLAMKKDHWRDDWSFESLRAKGAHIIMPEDPIDSYALVESAEAIVTCGSTIGVEAAYMGKPSLMVGDHHPSKLGICRTARNFEDMSQFVENPRPTPNAQERALIFGSYMQIAGLPISGLRDGFDSSAARLDGRVVDPARRIVSSIRKILS